MKNLIKPKIKTNWLYIIIITLIASFIIGGILIYQYQRWPLKEIEENRLTRSSCLTSDEIADFDYNIDLYSSRGVKIPYQSTTTIYIRNKNTNKEIFRFTISDVYTNSDSLEIHKCGVYVIRNFDLDEKKDFYKRHELWRYTFNGEGKILMNNEELLPYDPIVRVDLFENYLALTQYYLGHPDHAIVIKNLKIPQLEDILIIRPIDIWQNSPQLNKERRIGVVGWSKNGKYLWGGSESQTDYAYFRINIDDREKKNLEVFPMPDDAVNYGPPQVDTGYIWYIYGPVWTGIHEISEQIYEEWRKENKKENLYLYNLFTKEKFLLSSIDDPSWNFKPKWISDTELEYELPTGERKIYKINE